MKAVARAAAPGRLGLIEQFVNSLDRQSGQDELATLDAARGWLVRNRLAPAQAELSEAERRKLVEVRQAYHELLPGNSGGAAARRAVTTLNEMARQIRLGIRFHPEDGYRLMSEGLGTERVIGELLVPALVAMAAGEWPRLKVCANAACGRAFYDSSRNRSGRWCSMAVCGNRMKGRAYRGRRGSVSRGSAGREAAQPVGQAAITAAAS